MQTLLIKGDDLSPTIILNPIKCIFSIEGESRPENPLKYFEPVFSWFNEYFNYYFVLNNLHAVEKSIPMHLKISLDYFNSTSAKVLFDLFSLLYNTGFKKFKINFEVDWHCNSEDTDMLEAGQEMETMCGIKFNYFHNN